VKTSCNGFLVTTGIKLVLIGVGAGPFVAPTLGNLVANLKAAGYQPEQVDEIYITHTHSDHVGGLMNRDRRVFPNATVRADQRNAEQLFDPAKLEPADDHRKQFFTVQLESLKPYNNAGRFKPFSGAAMLTSGISSLATRGHTPGHSAYVVESNGQRLEIWGDLVHVSAIQFENPAIGIQFDSIRRRQP
jgi:glyoxylase-like metal-dependent hydrolase (beta-lactamase superfamily II)